MAALGLQELAFHSLPHVQSKVSLCSSLGDASTVADLTEEFDVHSTPEPEFEEFDDLSTHEPELGDSEPDPPRGRAWTGRWRIVWCHERVHKRELEAERKALSEAARNAGASLVCLKKASKFDIWLSRARRPPYVLVTDWREAKPCLQAASVHPEWQRPCLMVVAAEQRPLFERASQWVAALPPSGEVVRVRHDIGPARDFVESAREHLCTRGGLSEEARQPLPVVTAPASGKDPEQFPALAGTCIKTQSSRHPEVLLDCFFSAVQELARCSPKQIEHVLRQAVPDHYDD
jgi:hypothetical protein